MVWHTPVAQRAEQATYNCQVGGSSPPGGTARFCPAAMEVWPEWEATEWRCPWLDWWKEEPIHGC